MYSGRVSTERGVGTEGQEAHCVVVDGGRVGTVGSYVGLEGENCGRMGIEKCCAQ